MQRLIVATTLTKNKKNALPFKLITGQLYCRMNHLGVNRFYCLIQSEGEARAAPTI